MNKKISSSRPRASTIKHDHILKMTVLKGIRIHFLSTAKFKIAKRSSFSRLKKFRRVKEMEFLSNISGKVLLWSTKVFLQNSHFNPVALLYYRNSWATRTNFSVQCAFNNKPLSNFNICPILTFVQFSSQLKEIFTFFYFKI